MTTFPVWDAVAVGLARGCTGAVVAVVAVAACDVVPAICMRLPLILITANTFRETFKETPQYRNATHKHSPNSI